MGRAHGREHGGLRARDGAAGDFARHEYGDRHALHAHDECDIERGHQRQLAARGGERQPERIEPGRLQRQERLCLRDDGRRLLHGWLVRLSRQHRLQRPVWKNAARRRGGHCEPAEQLGGKNVGDHRPESRERLCVDHEWLRAIPLQRRADGHDSRALGLVVVGNRIHRRRGGDREHSESRDIRAAGHGHGAHGVCGFAAAGLGAVSFWGNGSRGRAAQRLRRGAEHVVEPHCEF